MVFIPDGDFIPELERSDETREALKGAGEAARARAEGMAPRIMPRNSSAIAVVEDDDGAVYLVNTDYGGHLAEWGSANNPPYAPLRRGVRAAGLRLDESD